MLKRLTPLFIRCTLRELIEYMEITFILNLTNYTTFLKKVVRDLSAHRFALSIKHNL